MACSDCFKGSLHEGTPTGRVETLHGLPTYIAEPPSDTPKGIIVYIPDAFGWEFNNNRILADTFAKRVNARVYLPEFMNGHAAPAASLIDLDTITSSKASMISKILPVANVLYSFLPFKYYNRISVVRPRVYAFFHALRIAQGASLPIGAAGFCWGGKYVFELCSDSEKASNGKSLIDCGFTAHPSKVVIPQDADAVTKPLSVVVGDADIVMPLAQVEMTREILRKKGDEHEVVIIPGAKHGFAVRAAPEDEKAVEQAEDQAVKWFERWFREVAE